MTKIERKNNATQTMLLLFTLSKVARASSGPLTHKTDSLTDTNPVSSPEQNSPGTVEVRKYACIFYNEEESDDDDDDEIVGGARNFFCYERRCRNFLPVMLKNLVDYAELDAFKRNDAIKEILEKRLKIFEVDLLGQNAIASNIVVKKHIAKMLGNKKGFITNDGAVTIFYMWFQRVYHSANVILDSLIILEKRFKKTSSLYRKQLIENLRMVLVGQLEN